MNDQSDDWPNALYEALAAAQVSQVGYVPDAGHRRLIELAERDNSMQTIALSTEEEGVALAAGAWLGGQRSVVLMQSSGLGNCGNAIASVSQACGFPLLMLITMRGEWGEANPWQIPMGSAVEPLLGVLGVKVTRLEQAGSAFSTTEAVARQCFAGGPPAALLIAQQLIGAKVFSE